MKVMAQQIEAVTARGDRLEDPGDRKGNRGWPESHAYKGTKKD